MKKLLFALSLVLLSMSIHAQSAINTLFKQYADNDKFTAVYVSEAMFAMFGEIKTEDADDQAVMDILKGLKELHVLTTEEGDGLKYYEEASKKINSAAYKTLVTVRDKDENVKIFVKEEGKIITELLVLVGSKEEFVLVSLIGKIDLKQISKLSGQMDIKGLDQLKKMDEQKGAEDGGN